MPENEMTDKEASRFTLEGFDLLMSQAKVIAMLPLEDWLMAFEKAEEVGAYLDPTLYRTYVQNPQQRGEIIKSIIRAALPLKTAFLKAQSMIGKSGVSHARE